MSISTHPTIASFSLRSPQPSWLQGRVLYAVVLIWQALFSTSMPAFSNPPDWPKNHLQATY